MNPAPFSSPTLLSRALRFAVVLRTTATIGLSLAPVHAHEQEVHCRITQEAVQASRRFMEVATELGWFGRPYGTTYFAGAEMARPAVAVLPRNAAGLVMAGSVLEDGREGSWPPSTAAPLREFVRLRCLRHFQGPDGQPIVPGVLAAGEWGYDGSANGFSWKDATSHYETSVLDPDAGHRVEAEERMLVALGCNLHLLQDQTSPAHTRDDAHMGHSIPLFHATGFSLLEDRGAAFVSMNQPLRVPADGFAIPSHPTHRRYFDALVDWTSARFFSDDTIGPDHAPPSAWTLDTSGTCPHILWFLRSKYYRGDAAQYGPADRLAQRVPIHVGVLPPIPVWFDTLAGSRCDAPHRLDSVVHDNLTHLVPAAVAYSAGLIDHFFRGRLGLEQLANGDLAVTNLSWLPPGSSASVDFTQDPSAHGPIELVVAVERTDLSRVQLPPESIGSLALGETRVLPGIAGRLPNDANGRIVVCLRNARIGEEAAVATGSIEWAACPEVCFDPPVPIEETPVGDADGDGRDDFVVHTPIEPGQWPPLSGSLALYSGTDCTEKWKRSGTEEAQLFGAFATTVGPWDTTPGADMVVQSRLLPGGASFEMAILRGLDGQTLHTFVVPKSGPLLTLGRVDLDAVLDFGIKTNSYEIRSGSTGALLRPIPWVTTTDRVSTGLDWTGDGVLELLVEHFNGSFVLVDPTNGTTVYSSSIFPDYSGYRDFVVVEDFQPDGVPDLVGVTSNSNVRIFSGQYGTMAYQLDGEGDQVAPAGNFNGIGGSDFVTRKLAIDSNGLPEWQITVWAPAGARELAEYRESTIGAGIPRFFGDLNADGRSEIAYAAQDFGDGRTCVKILLGTNAAP